MPAAEVVGSFAGEGVRLDSGAQHGRLMVAEAGGNQDAVAKAVARLGLTHDVSVELFESKWEPLALAAAAASADLSPAGSFAVRAERLDAHAPRRPAVERAVGAALAPGRRVDLRGPDSIVRAFAGGGRVWAGRRIWDRDPKDTAARHVQHRPVGSPVSLPPKLARALLNLARAPPGEAVYDPFCGTGGILLEAATMGVGTCGSDLDPRMVAAAERNLAHYRLPRGELFSSDVGAAPQALRLRGINPAAVVADLPYGRSSSSGKEPLGRLYDRAFAAIRESLKPGCRAVLGLPTAEAARRAAAFLDEEALFKVWVHRSLTRHFVVLRRPPA